jgi:hypothetical protein
MSGCIHRRFCANFSKVSKFGLQVKLFFLHPLNLSNPPVYRSRYGVSRLIGREPEGLDTSLSGDPPRGIAQRTNIKD